MRFFDYAERMPGSFEYYFVGDLHEGNSSCKLKLFGKCVNMIKSKKHAYCGLGGDMIDAIAPNDPRFDVDSVQPLKLRASKQRDGVIELCNPIADKILYVLEGNHEQKLSNVINISEEVAEGLGIYYTFPEEKAELPAYGTYMCKADFGPVRVLDWHGWGLCSSAAGDPLQIETNESIWVKRKLRRLAADCDVMVMHHIHRMRIAGPPRTLLMTTDLKTGKLKSSYSSPARIPIEEGGYRIPEEDRWYASSGSFLGGLAEGHSPYSERFGLPPTDMGCVKMVVKNGKLMGLEKVVFQEA